MEVGHPLIFNGQNAYVPWQVSLVDTYTNTHTCGGVILNAFVVLTAAHCFVRKGRQANESSTRYYYRNYNEFRIVAGQYSLKWRDPTEQIRYMDYWTVPASFDEKTLYADIALVFFKTPLKFNDKVKPIPLPSDRTPPKGNITLTGWGVGRNLPGNVTEHIDTLQTTSMEIMDNEECQKWYSNETDHVYESMFCAMSPHNVSTACSGDSGSPAVCMEATEYLDPPHTVQRKVLCGIVSWNGGECNVNSTGAPVDMYPTVFTRVSDYLSLINVQIRKRKYPGWWMCDDYQFIREDERCDYKADCEDWSDEANCPATSSSSSIPTPPITTTVATVTTTSRRIGNCSWTEFECAFTRRCIPRDWRCDGEEDCFLGDDEQFCPNATVSTTTTLPTTVVTTTTTSPTSTTTERMQFVCRDLTYIPLSSVCDGIPDCQDSSDEENCTVNEISSSTNAPEELQVDFDVTPCTTCSDGETNHITRRRNLILPPVVSSTSRSSGDGDKEGNGYTDRIEFTNETSPK